MNFAPILVIRNVTHEGPGNFVPVALERGFQIDDVNLDAGEMPLDVENYSGVIICGGPASANDESVKIKSEIQYVQKCIDAGVPLLGICLGMQILCKAAGGLVEPAQVKEIGFRDHKNEQFRINLTVQGQSDDLFRGCGESVEVFQLHGETVRLTNDISLLGTGDGCVNQVIKVGSVAYGIQSHIELTFEMLEQWITLDSELIIYDHSVLKQDYEILKSGYDKTAELIFNNFLDIVEAQLA